jgi:site-specific DNA recombinase
MKQAAMYVRVSTQQQKEGATIESQKALLLQHARKNNFEIHPEWIFSDNGVSGAKLARPALDRLRDFASEGLFEDVFILSPDRLSRKYAYQAILMDEFNGNGVKVHFQNSPDPVTATDHLLLQMQGMFAEYERAQIAERSRRGKKYKAKHGSVSVFSIAPYGYRYIKGYDQITASFEINEKEASVVKMIFDLYVNKRFSISKIRSYLSEHQIRSPKGNPEWSPSTINGMLKNSAYRGIAYFGKMEPCDPLTTRLASRSVRIDGRRQPRRCARPR